MDRTRAKEQASQKAWRSGAQAEVCKDHKSVESSEYRCCERKKRPLAEERHASAKLHKSWGSSPAAHGCSTTNVIDRPALSRGSPLSSVHHGLSSFHPIILPISPLHRMQQPAASSSPLPQPEALAAQRPSCLNHRPSPPSFEPFHHLGRHIGDSNRSILRGRLARPERNLPNHRETVLRRLQPQCRLSSSARVTDTTAVDTACAVFSPLPSDPSVETVQSVMATAGLTGGSGNAADLLRQAMMQK